MANRANHYEAAFEARVRSLRLPCVAVDEAKRAISGDEGLKNPDFLLYPGKGPNLVVEVKGKRGKTNLGRRAWENWVTTDDLDGLDSLANDVRTRLPRDPGVCHTPSRLPPFPLPPGRRRVRVSAQARTDSGRSELDDYIAHLRSRGPAWKRGRHGPSRVPQAGPAARRMVPRPLRANSDLCIASPPETRERGQPMIRRLLSAVTLAGALTAPTVAFAQEEAAPIGEEESSGSPIYGYLAFAGLAGLYLAILCRSSRRS